MCSESTEQPRACTASEDTRCVTTGCDGANVTCPADATAGTTTTHPQPCTACSATQYETGACNATTDRQCAACTICGNGQYQEQAGSTMCESCSMGKYQDMAADDRLYNQGACEDCDHGRFQGTVETKDGDLVINGEVVKVFAQKDPADIPWGSAGTYTSNSKAQNKCQKT